MKKTFLSSAIVSVLMVTSAMGMDSSMDINDVANKLFYENKSTYNDAASQVFSNALSVGKLSEENIYSESDFNLVRNAIQANIVSKYKKYSSNMNNALKDFVFTNKGRAWRGVVERRFDNMKKKIIEFLMRDMAYSDAQTKIGLDKKRQSGESSIDIVESIGLLFEGGIEVADIDPKTSSNLLKISGGSSFARGSQSLNDLPEDQRTPNMFLAIRSEIISDFKGKKRDELIGKEGRCEQVYRLLDKAVKSAKKKIGEGTKYTEKNIQYISNNELSYGFFPKSDVIYIVGSEGIKSSTENLPFDSQFSPEIKNEKQEAESSVDSLRDFTEDIQKATEIVQKREESGKTLEQLTIQNTKLRQEKEEAVFNAVKQVATDAQKTLNDKLDSLNTSIEKLDTGNKNNIRTKEYAQEQVKFIKADMAKAIEDAKTATAMKTVADNFATDAAFAQRIDALQKSIANTLETKAKTQAETELATAANTLKQTIDEAKAIPDKLAKIKTYEEDAKALISEYDVINQGLTDATNVTKSSEKEAEVQQINELKAKADELKQKAETLQKKKTDDEKNTEEAAEQERLKRELERKKAAEDLEKQKQEVQKIIYEFTTASADVKDLELNLSNEGTDNLDVQNPLQEDYLAKLTRAMKLISSEEEYALKRLDEGQGRAKNLHALRAAVANQRMSFVGKKDSDENVNEFIAAYRSFMDKSAQLITAASTTE